MSRPSPREYAPAAFSAGEVIAGGALTLGAYLVVSYLWFWIVTVVVMNASAVSFDALGGGWVWAYMVWIYSAMTALPAAIIGTATAALVGRAMQHRASYPQHLIAQGLHAYVIGALATVVCLFVNQAATDPGGVANYALLWGGPAAAFSALIGWRSIVAIARRRDRKRGIVAAGAGEAPADTAVSETP